jgi:hypothetical protein
MRRSKTIHLALALAGALCLTATAARADHYDAPRSSDAASPA